MIPLLNGSFLDIGRTEMGFGDTFPISQLMSVSEATVCTDKCFQRLVAFVLLWDAGELVSISQRQLLRS